LAELNALTFDEDEETKARAALTLVSLVLWDVAPIHLTDVEKSHRTNFMNFVEDREVLPRGETNDARILAETAIANIPMLVTSDTDILDADPVELGRAFDDAGLLSVRVASPRALWRAYSKPAQKRKH
jgi:hypothetical protein